jgi:hypothetical protein
MSVYQLGRGRRLVVFAPSTAGRRSLLAQVDDRSAGIVPEYAAGECNRWVTSVARLPTLGLRALGWNRLHLTVDGAALQVSLRTQTGEGQP